MTSLRWTHAERAALKELRAIYARADEAYAQYSCPASGECCQLAQRGRSPWLWRPEWLLLLERLEVEQRPLPPARPDGGCPFLDAAGKRCTVYASRPFGCRTYFCERVRGPGREPVERVAQLLARLERVALRLDEEDRPLPLPQRHAEARESDTSSSAPPSQL
jgi:Fe-S-cluster containining protein